jgi:hypothetical protein
MILGALNFFSQASSTYSIVCVVGYCCTCSKWLTHTHSVGLLWKSDRPVAEASIYKINTRQKYYAPSGIRTRVPSNWAAAYASVSFIARNIYWGSLNVATWVSYLEHTWLATMGRFIVDKYCWHVIPVVVLLRVSKFTCFTRKQSSTNCFLPSGTMQRSKLFPQIAQLSNPNCECDWLLKSAEVGCRPGQKLI